ncbi:MAG: hypothetical protein A3G33_08475 [Omnitrophica bacterium RIFCSPLOWO2_12_FULL_44_17]|uniref:Uncharacterized protein n=1 Tax=Candidatus Danuiimicrobium aquiferis TaxID=1801832 RepID=A0A1G1KWD6_9BACT|nr:MAG: hypothetical protein A3B72_03695 [Omnitrophica bacterium RIFCSPHIGHO2_02_FULL_45_28]OGW90310.1 MAG: hypothetical protein A3E74_01320 [Omnitrophica bacterium RIFCSPHIGHO2_12_FULL_44_12]OGW97200.1 MAG: hypothetical protein A3G33_08475 [Omnitrophica bacterium RIFCSPLOWO2_12_FULL_44_17]OGX02256.1 MAG: hypothetical protein A3J12_08265 [Omnitrophica bacterium RIFCSPLOWO2_02_FULL_44_11]
MKNQQAARSEHLSSHSGIVLIYFVIDRPDSVRAYALPVVSMKPVEQFTNEFICLRAMYQSA